MNKKTLENHEHEFIIAPASPMITRLISLIRQRITAAGVMVFAGIIMTHAIVIFWFDNSGRDAAAQKTRGAFFDQFGFTPIDFSWYGGINQFGYSLFTQVILAHVSPTIAGTVASLLIISAMVYIFQLTKATHPLLGTVAITFTSAANIIAGRVTFAIGLACGLWTLACAIKKWQSRIPYRSPYDDDFAENEKKLSSQHQFIRQIPGYLLILSGSALTFAASPVAGFLLLITTVWFWGHGALTRSNRLHALGLACLLTLPAGGVAAIMSLFNNGGYQVFNTGNGVSCIIICLLTAVWAPRPPVIVGAVTTATITAITLIVDNPLGSNIARMPLIFAFPVVFAYTPVNFSRTNFLFLPSLKFKVPWIRFIWVGLVTGIHFSLLMPYEIVDVENRNLDNHQAAFFNPLIKQLDQLPVQGRVEVVPLKDHWESYYVASIYPSPRGWLRQVDTAYNPLFYGKSPDAQTYREWLQNSSVQYVAIAVPGPNGVSDWAASKETQLVNSGLPYLHQIWRSDQWALYIFDDYQPAVVPAAFFAPGNQDRLNTTPASPDAGYVSHIEMRADRITFTAAKPGKYYINARWFPWLSFSGNGHTAHTSGCIRRNRVDFDKFPDHRYEIEATVPSPGIYTISSTFTNEKNHC